MENVIALGKRLLRVEQIALVELFDPSSNSDFKPEKEFKARVVLLNRDTVLTETSPQEFGNPANVAGVAKCRGPGRSIVIRSAKPQKLVPRPLHQLGDFQNFHISSIVP
jgi:hypothetical protein